MKKIFLILLLIMYFVGCKDVPPVSNLDDDTTTNTIPATPTVSELGNKDPFTGFDEFMYQDIDNQKIKVDTINKTLTILQSNCDDNRIWNPRQEFKYSYKATEDECIISCAFTKTTNSDGELITVQEALNSIEDEYRKNMEDKLIGYFYIYDEYEYTDDFDEDWKGLIGEINEAYGTSFTVEDFTKENINQILSEIMNSEEEKQSIDEYKEHLKKSYETLRKYSIKIAPMENSTENVKVATINIAGLYDDSKKWYEQETGVFIGDCNDLSGCFYRFYSYFVVDSVIYYVSSIDETKITTYYYDENGEKQTKFFNYTKTGKGDKTVMTVSIKEGMDFLLTWRPDSQLNSKVRIRKRLYGTAERPRIIVTCINSNLYMAVIDDDAGKVLGGISPLEPEFRGLKKQNTINATKLGEAFGCRLRDKKIKTVVFDRNGYLNYDVVKALADGLRRKGIEF